MARQLIAGNWKMNGLRAEALSLAGQIAALAKQASPDRDLLVCPPAHLLLPVGEAISGSPLALGGQDCHPAPAGAHTGDIGAPMLADAGCRYVIVGHSERRSDHGETSALVRAKAEAAFAAGLVPIICVGETAAERGAGRALAVIEEQIRGSLTAGEGAAPPVVAYEPVWAIGTGQTASPDDVAEAHGHIRALLGEILGIDGREVRLLYGGSVKPGNAAELLAIPDVDGALVGGASLQAEDFWAIATAAF